MTEDDKDLRDVLENSDGEEDFPIPIYMAPIELTAEEEEAWEKGGKKIEEKEAQILVNRKGISKGIRTDG